MTEIENEESVPVRLYKNMKESNITDPNTVNLRNFYEDAGKAYNLLAKYDVRIDLDYNSLNVELALNNTKNGLVLLKNLISVELAKGGNK